ncbi:M23 family metallopeptidase [Corynebacterium guangdongense]|uniref:Murein DD-endopeptidase MepM/ murein hydrolase activator NlpD n=1 Tax=Corynebacterium guangdongense TaxID=1783348 RepID=A0ABU1ZVN2_9CORY|nr:M23 family metallopeptidase [Corynebacterium guangdongense]MDR7328820.1 murein DD-endopeptidase MepM/ murein hydrolase activator NlpD [Corynebacterium guangdongense]WJZ17395.1 Murein hydrolase activator NlpD precursor [Corynebacterium guangdongense]
MRQNAQRSRGGKHRKVTTSQTSKGRVALVAIAAGAASSASVGGATAAQLQADNAEETAAPVAEYAFAANAVAIPPVEEAPAVGSSALGELSPQILPIAEYKPVTGLETQLDKAIKAAEERAAADIAARAPSVARPAEGVFTSGFGMRWGSLHAGIDIANAVGTPILAIMDGTVINSGPASGYGNWIRIQHDDGSISVYGHMVSLNVGVGERVHAGQNIAGMGNEGFSTGSHLHFEIHPAGMGAVDPVAWFAERGVAIS